MKDKKPKLEHMLSWYRDIYRGYWGHLSVRRILHSFPNYMIWDDHEIMDGWGSYTDDELSNELDRWWGKDDKVQNLQLAHQMFEAAKAVYSEYQHGHNPATPAGQYDYAFEWGPAAFYVLDMRGHRDYNRKTDDRILGPDQMKRFKAWLDKEKDRDSGHGVLFVITPVPVVHASSFFVNKLDLALFGIHDDLRDEWEHESNWVERDVLLDAVFDASEKSGKKVFFLSGDVHLGASFQLSDLHHPGAKVHQLTSSGITYAGLSREARGLEAGRGRLGNAERESENQGPLCVPASQRFSPPQFRDHDRRGRRRRPPTGALRSLRRADLRRRGPRAAQTNHAVNRGRPALPTASSRPRRSGREQPCSRVQETRARS